MKDNRRSEYNPNLIRRISQDQKSSVQLLMLADSTHMELNTFFPFDPYRLPRSNSYIQGVYREWSSVAIDDDDEDDEDDEDVVEHEDGLDVPRIIASDDGTGGLGESFGGMSISPTPDALPTLVT